MRNLAARGYQEPVFQARHGSNEVVRAHSRARAFDGQRAFVDVDDTLTGATRWLVCTMVGRPSASDKLHALSACLLRQFGLRTNERASAGLGHDAPKACRSDNSLLLRQSVPSPSSPLVGRHHCTRRCPPRPSPAPGISNPPTVRLPANTSPLPGQARTPPLAYLSIRSITTCLSISILNINPPPSPLPPPPQWLRPQREPTRPTPTRPLKSRWARRCCLLSPAVCSLRC